MGPAESSTVLPEVTILSDARGPRPENAAGIGGFWYEPEVWALPIDPAAKVLYAGLCSYLAHGQINRKDLRETLRDATGEEIARAQETLVRHNLISPERRATRSGILPGYEIRSVKEFEA